jgi:hypothetical protein
MSCFTEVALVHVSGRQEHWIRFGRHLSQRIMDRRRRVLIFSPGAVFAFVRWASNEHGTIESRIDIAIAAVVGQPFVRIPEITPGAISLLHLSSWPRVQLVLKLIDEAETIAGDGVDVSPDYWCHAHQRFTAGARPAAYSEERHRAWLLRRKLGQ